MTDNEDLIEEAAKAIFAEEQCDRHQKRNAASVTENWEGRLGDADKDEYRSFARAALAVFEKTYTPTDADEVISEREALAKKATTPDGRLEYHLLEGEAVTMYPYWAADLRTVIAGFRRTEVPEWEYGQSELLTDGTVAFGHPVETLEEAIRRRDIDRINYPWPEELGVGRRRKAGPWVPIEN